MREPIIKKKILVVVGICGVISKKGVGLIDASRRGKYQQIKDMEEKGWIKKKQLPFSYYCGKNREYKKETVYTLWNMKNKYEEYKTLIPLSLSQLLKSHQWSVQKGMYFRIMRQSEILVMMDEAWISITGEDGAKYIMASDLKEMMEKNLESTFDKERITSSRAYGAMLSWDNRLYMVFDLWYKDYQSLNRNSEKSMLRAAKRYLDKDCFPEAARRIAFIKSYDMMAGVINKRAGYQRFKTGITFLSDTLYKETLLIPKNRDGQKILFIITQENAQQELFEYANIPEKKSMSVICDGMEEDENGNNFHLNFLYPDANKLDKFLRSVKIDTTDTNRYIVHAYDCAAEAVARLHPRVEVRSYDLNDIYSMMLMKQI